MKFSQTDLAMENIRDDSQQTGADVHQWEAGGIQITEVIVNTESAAERIGKPMGRYLTLSCPLLTQHDPDARIAMSHLLGDELSRLISPADGAPVMVVGLGNRGVTPDALGPAAIDKTLVTRHMLSSPY